MLPSFRIHRALQALDHNCYTHSGGDGISLLCQVDIHSRNSRWLYLHKRNLTTSNRYSSNHGAFGYKWWACQQHRDWISLFASCHYHPPFSMSDSQENSKSRTLVLCFDGTASEYCAAVSIHLVRCIYDFYLTDWYLQNTNVVKLYAMLSVDANKQLCYYQVGIVRLPAFLCPTLIRCL